MLGAIIGDIVGSRFEFRGIKHKNFEFFGQDCHFTDDTVMTCAIAKALMQCNGDYSKLSNLAVVNMQEMGHKYPSAGYGGMFTNWLESKNTKPYNSYGNGSAMRVSSVAYFAKSLDEVKKLSRIVTMVTHSHPEGIKGAEATAVAVYLALKGKSKQEICTYIQNNYYNLKFDLNDIKQNYRFDDTCQGSVPQSIFAFLISNSFQDAVKTAVSFGGDTDTMGCITGSIAEAYYGIPQEIKAKAYKYLSGEVLKIVVKFEQAQKGLCK